MRRHFASQDSSLETRGRSRSSAPAGPPESDCKGSSSGKDYRERSTQTSNTDRAERVGWAAGWPSPAPPPRLEDQCEQEQGTTHRQPCAQADGPLRG